MLLTIWGESGSVLDKTQTFVGVLATLIVLCLIRDRTNFIFRLVQTIHLEADISRRTNELNKSIKDGDSLTGMIERITKKYLDARILFLLARSSLCFVIVSFGMDTIGRIERLALKATRIFGIRKSKEI